MKINENFNEKYARAIIFATQKHSKQKRKVVPWPYIVHLYEVAQILIEHKAPEDVIIAGVLHDVIEDTDTKLEEIVEKFGYKVGYLVDIVSENKELSYNGRKELQVERIKKAGQDAKLLKCADLYSNLRSLYLQIKSNHDESLNVWDYFNSSLANISFNYKKMLEMLSETLKDNSLFKIAASYYEKVFKEKIINTPKNEVSSKWSDLKIKSRKLIKTGPQIYSLVDGQKLTKCNDCKYFKQEKDWLTFDDSPYNFDDDYFQYTHYCKKINSELSGHNQKNELEPIPQYCPYAEK